ncbi:MAG TPA: efflux RND transporter periplasmic adaptor subunit [Rhizomicrobium sp.]|jgi:membrane fusion protein, multidrug efflux system|nr:efflux RND transporter periplasmic adaptor subunit [Rhizomicrobium sp.]
MNYQTPTAQRHKQFNPRTRTRRNWILAGLGALAILIVAGVLLLRHPAKPAPPPSIPVNVAKATSNDIPISITALGAAQAWYSVTVLAQVSGKLLSVNFTEGTDVKKGQVLAQIDPAPYLAVLTQAQGTLKHDQALLADARLDLKRYESLLAANAIAEQMVDTQKALVEQYEGTVKADEGTVAAAQVNVGWCSVVSPIDGRAGVRLVDPGNLVSASGSVSNTPSTAAATNSSSSTGNSGSGIVTVNQIQPIAVTFTVPEGNFQQLQDLSHAFQLALVTKAVSQESGALLDSGEVTIADNHVDPATGTVELKARFPNAQRHLWPGQFVNVQLTLQTLHHVTTIPAAAINRGPNGSYVFIVGADKKVTMKPVAVSWTQGDTVVIKSGVNPGDTVVVDGQMILTAGSLVRVVTPAAPKQPNP